MLDTVPTYRIEELEALRADLRNVMSFLDEAVRAGILDGTEIEQQFGDIRRTLGQAAEVAA